MATYGVVLVTAGSEPEARAIARALVQDRLVACANLYPIESIYTWQGEIHQDQEWQIVLKTDLAIFPRLEARIRELHSYDVPEIIALPIHQSSQPYLEWISSHVHP